MRDTNSRYGFVNSVGIHLLLDYLPRSEPTSIPEKQELPTHDMTLRRSFKRQDLGMKMLESEYILWMILECSKVTVRKSTRITKSSFYIFLVHDFHSPALARYESRILSSYARINGHRRIGTLL